MQDLLIKIIASGLVGFFSYIYLTNTNVIYFPKNRSEERKMMITGLTLFHTALGLLIYEICQTLIPLTAIWLLIVSSTIVVVINIVFMIFINPLVLKAYYGIITLVRKKKNLGGKTASSNWRKVFHRNESAIVHIYDFSGNMIFTGFTKRVPEDIEYDYFDMILDGRSISGIEISELSTIKMFENFADELGHETEVYLDFEKRLKFYVSGTKEDKTKSKSKSPAQGD
ncbi:hypothetical protein [Listeria booriae]|uniref:hypothetical protein n=1 Tax=Listeria booriae TaxID=1552123 RepID=UPI001624124A|nr:hypothetical protein [Listeria booriae]MBC1210535.1 hypothetical protein [Listeria booriae]MBC1228197.1 hypothetical protein [Listeria booriae]